MQLTRSNIDTDLHHAYIYQAVQAEGLSNHLPFSSFILKGPPLLQALYRLFHMDVFIWCARLEKTEKTVRE